LGESSSFNGEPKRSSPALEGNKVKAPDVHKYFSSFSLGQNFTLLSECDKKTSVENVTIDGEKINIYINEFWTSGQRQASPLQEISYRACFKPQLPRFFIRLLTEAGDIVYDPFMGRGTTLIEAALLGRRVIGNDINPLSRILTEPRLNLPDIRQVQERLFSIPVDYAVKAEVDLSMFYHPRTEAEIVSLRRYLLERSSRGLEDDVDRWIRMVATNRLTGHSPGFFSVYTLPPNQAVSPERQKLLNEKRKQSPEYRDVKRLILKKTCSLLAALSARELEMVNSAGREALLLASDARHTPSIKDEVVALTVTSPPFLDIVQYTKDNWLRCWFNHIDAQEVEKKLTMARNVEEWSSVMQEVFFELYRVTRKGGWVAFEVGEIRKGEVRLEEQVVPLGKRAGFTCLGVMINKQLFTKTSNIWGIKNNRAGTNTNRIALFYKQDQ